MDCYPIADRNSQCRYRHAEGVCQAEGTSGKVCCLTEEEVGQRHRNPPGRQREDYAGRQCWV